MQEDEEEYLVASEINIQTFSIKEDESKGNKQIPITWATIRVCYCLSLCSIKVDR